MPTALQIEREADEYRWLLDQAKAVERRRGIDYAGLSEFLEEAADEMLARVTSQIVNLLAHAAKAAHTKNPQVIGHWRSECVEFHDQIVDAYRPSMRQKIDMQALWKRAKRKVYASFEDHGEPRPKLPNDCLASLEALIDPELRFEMMLPWMICRKSVFGEKVDKEIDEFASKMANATKEAIVDATKKKRQDQK